jgi:geranylgeranyl diphosphate synthase type II
MHDDIMDNAPLRRGKPTVHHKWNGNVAILSGDVMLVKAYELLMDLEQGVMKEALHSFNKCASAVCEGQQLDMNFESKKTVTEEEYIEMIGLKTAALVGFSLELGGIIAQTSATNRNLLREFGINMGIGFQLMDDLLDVFGDHKKFGKQVGGDIAANKKTFLTIKAFEKAEGKDLEKLKKLFNEKQDDSSKKIKEITDIYKKLGIKELTEAKINYYFNEGLKKLSKVDAPLYKKAIVKDLANSLLQREN